MAGWQRLPLLLYGIFLLLTGLALHVVGAVALVLRVVLSPALPAPAWPARLLVISAGLILVAAVFAVLDLVVCLPRKRRRPDVMMDPPSAHQLTVVLTAFNDEQSIGPAVDDFRSHPLVRR